MKYVYNKKVNVTADHANTQAELSITGAFTYQQEMVTEFLATLKKDNVALKNDYNCAWVFTKCHAEFVQYPEWNDNLIMESSFVSIKSGKLVIKTELRSASTDNLKSRFYLEMCVINRDTRRIVRLSSINFPSDAEWKEESTVFNTPVDEYDSVIKRPVLYSDLDMTRHVNNVAYFRFISDSLGLEFFDKYHILTLDIHYKSEIRPGSEIEVYKKMGESRADFKISKDNEEAALVIITY